MAGAFSLQILGRDQANHSGSNMSPVKGQTFRADDLTASCSLFLLNAGALLFGGASEHGRSTRLLFFIFIIFPRRAHVGFDREFLWNVFVAGLQLSGRFPVAAKGDTGKFAGSSAAGRGAPGGAL